MYNYVMDGVQAKRACTGHHALTPFYALKCFFVVLRAEWRVDGGALLILTGIQCGSNLEYLVRGVVFELGNVVGLGLQ